MKNTIYFLLVLFLSQYACTGEELSSTVTMDAEANSEAMFPSIHLTQKSSILPSANPVYVIGHATERRLRRYSLPVNMSSDISAERNFDPEHYNKVKTKSVHFAGSYSVDSQIEDLLKSFSDKHDNQDISGLCERYKNRKKRDRNFEKKSKKEKVEILLGIMSVCEELLEQSDDES